MLTRSGAYALFGGRICERAHHGGPAVAYGNRVTLADGTALEAAGPVLDLAFTPHGSVILAAPHRHDLAAHAWDRLPLDDVTRGGHEIVAATWDDVGERLLLSTRCRPGRLAPPGPLPQVRSRVALLARTAEQPRLLVEDDDHMRSAVALMGDIAAVAGRDLAVWHTSTGEEAARLALDGHRAEAVAIHQDGRVVAAALADGTVRVWRVDGAPVLLAAVAAHEGAATGLAFRQDGTMVTCGDDGRLALHDATGRRLAEAQLPDPLGDLSLSPDGTRVAVIARPPASGAAEYTIVSE